MSRAPGLAEVEPKLAAERAHEGAREACEPPSPAPPARAVPARAAAPAAAPAPPPRGLTTRRRLFLAFAALAGAFAAAFAAEILGLQRMEDRIASLHDHQDQVRLALELESAIHNQFAHQAHFIVGEYAHLAGHQDAARRAAGLVQELSKRVDEPEAIAWVAEMGKASRELDRIFNQEIAPAVLARKPAAMMAHDKTYRLVFELEENTDRLFALLRGAVSDQSRAVDAVHRSTIRLSVAFLAATALVALALAVHLSRSIARPLKVLGAGAARIAAGDLRTRIELRTADEFGALAAEFNQMASALAQHQERLLRSEKLAGLGRVAAGVAHEMNNPLQVMLGYLSLNRDKVEGQLKQDLSRIEREALRCKEIVEDLLQLARPAVAFVPVPVDLREVAEEVAHALRVGTPACAPQIVVEGAGSAFGTRCRFRQIVFNLAKNAAEAAGSGGTVRIEVAPAGELVEVAVSDDGPGIPAELRDRIFEPFFTTKSSGTGLGLAIARSIAAALDGDLEIDDSVTRGARIVLRVPRAGS